MPAGVTEPATKVLVIRFAHVLEVGNSPESLGVKVAAAAAFGEMPSLAGCAAAVFGVKLGVKDGDSTLRLFFWLHVLSFGLLATWRAKLTR